MNFLKYVGLRGRPEDWSGLYLLLEVQSHHTDHYEEEYDHAHHDEAEEHPQHVHLDKINEVTCLSFCLTAACLTQINSLT